MGFEVAMQLYHIQRLTAAILLLLTVRKEGEEKLQ
jgi:hypothetical protein